MPPSDKPERPGSRRFFHVRVAVLLVVLCGVLVYAWHDVHSRHARKDWDHTLQIAIVVLRLGPVDDNAIVALRGRIGALDARLAAEKARYLPGAGSNAQKPFAFTVFGPVDVAQPAPMAAGDGIGALIRHSWDLKRYLHAADQTAAVSPDAFDSRVYVVVRPPANAERTAVEGESEQDGRIGTVGVELDESMADFALIVVAHELLHTLGATDKYDATGRTRIPLGLAEPDRVPMFPQRFVEIMARNVALSANEERVPEGLDELSVGAATAREIGWTRVP